MVGDPVGNTIFFLFWLLLLFSIMEPIISLRRLQAARLALIRQMERKYSWRVVTLIHREERVTFFGIPIQRFIDIDDSEAVLRAIRTTPPDKPIALILHTPGGLALAASQIARALKRHPGKKIVIVPHYAMSGGTLIALAADEILMDPNAVLGPVDPQLGQYPAASILKVLETKDINKIDDQTLIMADISRKAIKQVKRCIKTILSGKMPEHKAEELADLLSRGEWTHDYPITYQEAKELGLPVSTEMPVEVYQLMSLYPQPVQSRPSVQYIPMPYKEGNHNQQS